MPEPPPAELVELYGRLGAPLPNGRQQRRFDSELCRKRAFRRRRAGVPEDSYVDGAARGHVPLGELTQAERREHWEQIAEELRLAREQVNGRPEEGVDGPPSVYERRGLAVLGESSEDA